MVIALALSMAAMASAALTGESGTPTITSPMPGEHILSDVVVLSGIDVEPDVRWALRKSTAEEDPFCTAQTDVAGNVRGFEDEAEIDEDGNFRATINRVALQLEPGEYCFNLNQGAPSTASTERAFVFFFLSTPDSKDACKDGGWMTFGDWQNQGECVSSFARMQRAR